MEWRGRIESLALDGRGVGTIETEKEGASHRRPIFVPDTCPGDEVVARIVEQCGKYSFGELVRVERPSAHRTAAVCPHFGVCGGCAYEHVAYDEQVRQKRQQIAYLLKRAGIEKEVHFLSAKQQHAYRHRARILLRLGDGKVRAGFRKRRSHDLVEVQRCFILVEEIGELLRLLNDAVLYAPACELELFAVKSSTGKLGLLINTTGIDGREKIEAFFEEFYGRHRELIGNLFLRHDEKTTTLGQVQEHIDYTVAGLRFAFRPETFIQANLLMDETLITTVIETVKPGLATVALDLYCGIGNFTLPLAKRCSFVVGVEGARAAVPLARTNATMNAIPNVRFVHENVEQYLAQYVDEQAREERAPEYARADVVVLDPPRTGAGQVVCERLLATDILRIVYVSCNPVTLADDLRTLRAGYEVLDVVGIDMFPDTVHVEVVVTLRKKE